MDLSGLVTERRRPELADLDLRATPDLVRLMIDEERRVVGALVPLVEPIAAAADAIAGRMTRGGRLVYVGAGTAGRLGLLDAAECGPTFNTDRVVGVLAGGSGAFEASDEAAEDEAAAGRRDLAGLAIGNHDAVVGVSASGRTPYTLTAVGFARERGALTVGISSNPNAELSSQVDIPLEVITGPEVVAGSTRLKAGTAQKIILNVLSTVTMVRLGKTFGDLMVDVRATSDKLHDRARRIVAEATGLDREAAARALSAAGGDVKTAVVAALAGIPADEAARRLSAAGGNVRRAVDAASS